MDVLAIVEFEDDPFLGNFISLTLKLDGFWKFCLVVSITVYPILIIISDYYKGTLNSTILSVLGTILESASFGIFIWGLALFSLYFYHIKVSAFILKEFNSKVITKGKLFLK